MIFNNSDIYAKIWKVTKPKDDNGNFRKYLELQISTSEKNQNEDKYIYSDWYPRVIGHAYNTLKDLEEGELKSPISIKITKSKFSNEKYVAQDGTKKRAFKFLILEASLLENKAETSPAQSESVQETPQNEEIDQDCPW